MFPPYYGIHGSVTEMGVFMQSKPRHDADMYLLPGVQRTPESPYMVISACSANNATTLKECRCSIAGTQRIPCDMEDKRPRLSRGGSTAHPPFPHSANVPSGFQVLAANHGNSRRVSVSSK